MRLVYTTHLRLRLKLRLIPFNLPRIVVLQADEFFLDRKTVTYIAVKRFADSKEYMVSFVQRENELLIINIHTLRFRQKANRIVSKRWQRVKRKI